MLAIKKRSVMAFTLQIGEAAPTFMLPSTDKVTRKTVEKDTTKTKKLH